MLASRESHIPAKKRRGNQYSRTPVMSTTSVISTMSVNGAHSCIIKKLHLCQEPRLCQQNPSGGNVDITGVRVFWQAANTGLIECVGQ